MKKFMSYDGTLMMIFTKIMYMVAANLLFLVCSIPIVTIGASAAAMYSLLMRYKKGDEPDILKTFFSAFREHWKKSTKAWLMMLGLALTLMFNYYIIFYINVAGISNVIRIILNTVLLILVIFWIYLFPAIAYFENSLWGYICFAVGVAISKLPYMILLAGIHIIPFGIVLFMAQYSSVGVILLFCCGFSLPAWLSSSVLMPIFARYGGVEVDGKVQE